MNSKSITTRIDKELVKKMVDVIVQEIEPEQIYLFGSAARNDIGADSDVDFLIVENKSFDRPRSRLNEIKRIRRALASYRVSKDILVYNGEEVEKWRDNVNHIIGRCVQEGRLLYERHRAKKG